MTVSRMLKLRKLIKRPEVRKALVFTVLVGVSFYAAQAIVYKDGHREDWRTMTPPLRPGNASAVEGLLKRLLPQYQDQFLLQLDISIGTSDKDTFILQSVNGKMNVKGNSAIALSMGLHYYLKYYCKAHVSWNGDQLRIPQPLPVVQSPVTITSQDKYRHYQNVCTFSYSSLWWDWPRWEREIDWMALNGINLPLAFTAQEAIWRKVFLGYGFTDDEINVFFSGPSFLAWYRMGNIQGLGGPLSPAWHNLRVALQKLILGRMREFGMFPVLPAFAGRVLPAFQRIFPNASVTKNFPWAGFRPPYCCTTILDPLDPLFVEIGSAYLKEYQKEFGIDHFYNADLFNEMVPPISDPSYLKNSGMAVFESLTNVDSQAIWVMQGWLFVNDPSVWPPAQAKALLTSVPLGRMVVLDLEAEFRPQYVKYESFYGQPFIWCIIHNYGGVQGLYGSFSAINQGPFKGRSYPNSTMIGTGLTPEGIERNDVIYDLMNEMAWRDEPVDMDRWIYNYTLRRYGKTNDNITEAWTFLKDSVYNASVNHIMLNHGQYIYTSRPSTKLTPYIWYDPEQVFSAIRILIQEPLDPDLESQETFMYDITDFTRQGFQLLFDSLYSNLMHSYQAKNISKMNEIGSAMLSLLDDLEGLLLSNERFRLDTLLSNATSWATTSQEAGQYEWNIRNQISLFGPKGEFRDYANKQWGGVVSGYFKPRWDLFLNFLQKSVTRGIPFNQTEYDDTVMDFVEEPFTYDRSTSKVQYTEGTLDFAHRFLNKLESYYEEGLVFSSNYTKPKSHSKLFPCCAEPSTDRN